MPGCYDASQHGREELTEPGRKGPEEGHRELCLLIRISRAVEGSQGLYNPESQDRT